MFDRWPDILEWRAPRAGSVALVGMNVRSVNALTGILAESHGLLIQSGEMLGADDRSMRIGFGRAGFGEALGKFEAAIELMPMN